MLKGVTNGVSSATLVRLFQYAEIPIPTSTTQGAFSVSFINPGEDGYSNAKADRELTKINVTWGRISALGSVPAQIKLSNLQRIERFQREENEIETWIWETLQGTCPQKVLCFDEENNTDWYMQFHIPTKSEKALPTKMTLDDEAILVEHARPYAYLQTGAIRPPAEETMHEHWKNAARLAPSERKDRSNFIAHVENNFASLQRISLLHEFPVIHQGVRYIGTCEASQFPILFINGEVTVDRCIRTLIENSGSFPELQDELQESYDSYIQDPPIPNDFRCQTPVAYVLSVCSSDLTPINIGRIVKGSRGLFVSSTELLKCHAYTKCTVAILLPKGIKLELVCTPSRHIEILAKIPVASSPRQSQSIVTQPTALGVNDTNVAELSQALQSSLSLDTNTGLPQPNASVESYRRSLVKSMLMNRKKGILLKPKFLPLFQVVRDLLLTPHPCAMNFIVKRLSPPLLHGLLNKIPNLKELVVYLLTFPGQETPRRYRSYIRSFTDKNRYYNSSAVTDAYTSMCI